MATFLLIISLIFGLVSVSFAEPVVRFDGQVSTLSKSDKKERLLTSFKRSLRKKRKSLTRLLERAELTVDEGRSLRRELDQINDFVQKLENSKGAISKNNRRKAQEMLHAYSERKERFRYNSDLAPDMSNARMRKLSNAKNEKAMNRYSEEFKELDLTRVDDSVRNSVNSLKAQIEEVIEKSRKNKNQNDPQVRKRLAQLRLEFNRAMGQARKQADRNRYIR